MTIKHGLSKDQVATLEETFKMFDIDGDGTITLVELKKVMSKLGHRMSEKQLLDMINTVDADGDHEIDFDEFLVLFGSAMKDGGNDEDKDLRDAFNRIDTDSSGCISRSELGELMNRLSKPMTKSELDDMMSIVDSNGDGTICFTEFKTMYNDMM